MSKVVQDDIIAYSLHKMGKKDSMGLFLAMKDVTNGFEDSTYGIFEDKEFVASIPEKTTIMLSV